MASFDFKKYLPHLIILAVFTAIAAIWGWAGVTGKILVAGDNVHWQGMVHEAMSAHEKTGANPLWSNSMFGGMPTYTYYLPGSNNLIGGMQAALQFLSKPGYFPFTAMICFYVLMLVLRVNKWLGAVGALGFAFATFNVILIGAGHETELLSIAYMPAVIAGVILAYRGNYLGGAAVTAISMAMMMTNSHYQIMYYTLIILVVLGIFMLITAIKEGKIKQFAIATVALLVAAFAGIGTNGGGFLATKEYNKATMRGGTSEVTFIKHDENKKNGGLDRNYAFGWSNGWGESFCALVPDLYGGSSGEDLGPDSHYGQKLSELGVSGDQFDKMVKDEPTYWGPQQFLSGPVYFGAVICFLFVLGLFAVRSPHKWWLVIASAIGFALSLGKHFPALNNFLFDHLPMYNNFRTPTMALAIPEVLFPVLGIWGLHDIITDKWTKAEVWQKIKLATIITAGLCLVLGAGNKMFFNHHSQYMQEVPDGRGGKVVKSGDEVMIDSFGGGEPAQQLVSAIREDRASMATTSGLKSALFVLLAAALLWALYKGMIKKEILFAGLAVLILADLLPIAHRYLNDDNYADSQEEFITHFFPKRPVDEQILKDPDPYYRVLDLSDRNNGPFNNAAQAYWHKCVGGYSPTKMETYQDMIDVHMSRGFNHEVLNMLNTKYIISPPQQNGQIGVIPNTAANGNAWFVSNIHWAPSADSEILFLNAPDFGDTAIAPANHFNSKETAVLRTTYQKDLGSFTPMKDSAASIKLVEYGLNDITFKSNNGKDGLGVFSDIYYDKGWKAYIDGKEVPIIKANYILRALKIPAGQHDIKFSFRPESWKKGNAISLIASIMVIIICIAGLVFAFRKPKNETATVKES